jgi:hypothetical protein
MNSRLTSGKRCRDKKIKAEAHAPFRIQGFFGWLRTKQKYAGAAKGQGKNPPCSGFSHCRNLFHSTIAVGGGMKCRTLPENNSVADSRLVQI